MNGIRKKCRRLSRPLSETPITYEMEPFISKDTSVFVIGSCFAQVVQKWLLKNSYNVFHQTKYELVWYNTYSIMAEFQRVVGEWMQSSDDVWQLKDGRWQDPYRRNVFADSKQELLDDISCLDVVLSSGITEADVVIVTLGLTEVYLRKNNKAICCYSKEAKGCRQVATDYEWNAANVHDMVSYLRGINRDIQIILTVSPVAMFSTFRGIDHVIANIASKSILRAVTDHVVGTYENVHYFHSYELIMNGNREDVLAKDGRHISTNYVTGIMEEFERMFVKKNGE